MDSEVVYSQVQALWELDSFYLEFDPSINFNLKKMKGMHFKGFVRAGMALVVVIVVVVFVCFDLFLPVLRIEPRACVR